MRRISRSIDDCLRKLIHPMWLPAQLMVFRVSSKAAALVKDGDRCTKSVRSSKKEAGDSLGETGRVQENEFPIQENKLAARDFLGAWPPNGIPGPIYFPGPGTHLKQRLKFHISAFPCTSLAAMARCHIGRYLRPRRSRNRQWSNLGAGRKGSA